MDVFAGDIEIDLPPDDEDPHVRVSGAVDNVRVAGALVRQELEPHNKVTMKLDVSWTHHSHIIGKGGNTIQPVVKRTGVSIHFPDGNKNSEVRKSNQVSINSRGEELAGLEDARGAIRELTPLIFTFSLSASAQFINISDPNMLVLHVQNNFNVQVDLKVTDDLNPLILGSVRGCEWDAARVKEATLFVLQAYCDTLATQMPVQMTVEISPQHHAFVLGRNNENLKRIMQRTATKIDFPDSNDISLPLIKKSTVIISGAIDNVYLARQNILGALPLVLMFDLMPDYHVDTNEQAQIMQTLDVNIIIKNKRLDGRRPVIIKGAEKNAGNIYEAWRLLSRSDKIPPKARIPPSYHIAEAAPLYGITNLNLGHWLGGGSANSSPLPSPTASPAPAMLPSTLWGAAPGTTTHLPAHFPQSHYNVMLDRNNFYAANLLLRSGGLNACNNNNCIMPKPNANMANNLNALVNSLGGMAISNSDGSGATSSNSGSSLSSPAPSPRDSPPDQVIASQMSGHLENQYPDPEPSPTGSMSGLSMLLDLDRRAPGCEKKHIEMTSQKMTSTFTDYNTKKVQAAKAMKEQVSSSPRTPTSNWSGYGFSKSMPGFMMQQKMHENRIAKNAQKGGGLEEWDEWKDATPDDVPGGHSASAIRYQSRMAQVRANLSNSDMHRSPVNLSASNYMDCVLPRHRDPACPAAQPDITSILTDIQLEQYIDVFNAQEVDLGMFLTLDDSDLKELGIKIFGHRKRIMMAIKDLSAKKPFSFGGNLSGGLECSGASAWE